MCWESKEKDECEESDWRSCRGYVHRMRMEEEGCTGRDQKRRGIDVCMQENSAGQEVYREIEKEMCSGRDEKGCAERDRMRKSVHKTIKRRDTWVEQENVFSTYCMVTQTLNILVRYYPHIVYRWFWTLWPHTPFLFLTPRRSAVKHHYSKGRYIHLTNANDVSDSHTCRPTTGVGLRDAYIMFAVTNRL